MDDYYEQQPVTDCLEEEVDYLNGELIEMENAYVSLLDLVDLLLDR